MQLLKEMKVLGLLIQSVQYCQFISARKLLKGPFCDSNKNVFMTFHKASLFSNFQSILILYLLVKHDLLYYTVAQFNMLDFQNF